MREVVLIVHDIRSTHNVGSLLRTAECLGVNRLIFTGYTPYPELSGSVSDARLPHIVRKLQKDISKTALGADKMIPWSYEKDITSVISSLRDEGYMILGLEQAEHSTPLHDYAPTHKIALIIGREVEGIAPELLNLCDKILEISQFGKKESLNVVQATAIALYHLSLPS